MTKKRFGFTYYDGVKLLTDGGKVMPDNHALDLLNGLSDENEQLKSLLNEISDKNNKIWLNDGRIIRLREIFKGEWK